MSESEARRTDVFYLSRWVVQAVFFVLFVVTVIFSMYRVTEQGYGFALPVPIGVWPRLSFFSAVVVSLAGRVFAIAFWPALVVLVAAILSGRAFCGWLCPLGATIDFVDRYAFTRRTAQPDDPAAWRRLKYYVLAAGLMTAVAGSAVFALFDALSIVVRLYVSLLDGAVWMAGGLLGWLSALPLVGGAAGTLRQSLGLQPMVRAGAGFVLASAVLMVFLPPVIALLAGRGGSARRFWCRFFCPLGAFLGLVGRWAVVKRRVSDACISCNHCIRECPTSCIAEGGKETLAGECILCGRCSAICPTAAISFLPGGEGNVLEPEVDLSRRGVVTGVLVGLWTATAGALSSLVLRKNPRHSFIRPPGVAGDEVGFLDRCVRCGACTRVCPKGAVHLDFHRGGLEGFGAPVVIPRLGYCEYDCNLCGRVCPSGAIPALPLDVKKTTPLGVARFDTTRCLPWVGQSRLGGGGEDEGDTTWLKDYTCLTCEENCPIPDKAIRTKDVQVGPGVILQVPYVEDSLCIGCGRCEYVCPLEGEAGVRVVRWKHDLRPAVTARTVSGLQAPSPAGWTLAAAYHYVGTEVENHIDGEAVAYYPYGFEEAYVWPYESPSGEKLTAEVYICDEPEHAFGLYTTRRSNPDRVLGGVVVSAGPAAVMGVKGKAYLCVKGPDGVERDVLLTAVGGVIEGEAKPPKVLSLLPAGFKPGTNVVLRLPQVTYDYLYLPFIDDVGLGEASEGALATYETTEGDALLVVVSFRNPAMLPNKALKEAKSMVVAGKEVRLVSDDPLTVAWLADDLLWAAAGDETGAVASVVRLVSEIRP